MRSSVIIPSFNEAKDIRKCLNAFAVQTKKPFEVIVVDGGSSDETVEVVKEFSSKQRFIKLVHETGSRSPANARNIGWQRAGGEIILFKDADAIVEKDYLKKIEEEFKESRARILEFKDERFLPEDANIIEKALFYKEASISGYGEIIMKKSVLEKIGGFDSTLGFGEDRILAEKLKKIGITKAKRTLRIACGRISGIKEFITRNLWYGRTIPKYLQKKQDNKVLVSAIIAATYFLSLVAIVTIPLFLILSALILLRGLIISLRAFDSSKNTAVFLIPFFELIRVFSMGIGLIYGVFLSTTGRYYAGR